MIGRAVTTAVILFVSIVTPFDRSSSFVAKDSIKVEVDRLLVSEESRGVILLLKPESASEAGDAKRVLPLVIGLEEGRSIGVAFHKMPVPRPLSHDLMKKIIEEYDGSVEEVLITKMERETFFAELKLKRGGRELTIDCRPSDAIALAMRSGAPIFVKRAVFEKLSVDPGKPGPTITGPRA